MKSRLLTFVENLFDIQDGKELDETIVESVQRNVEFRGANFWLLIFAIFIASIGLNINSIPVIIGAMLISPLMGPIVGLGLSLGINDSTLLRKSGKNLLIATIIGISISTLYFLLSPISNIQSELLARTSPTIYDVLIALFGGFSGIVGSTRTEKGNVIPGVAIATALMPPLCTVGYGLATGQPGFFLGAAYLYTINCIFICLATLAGVKILKLPPVAYARKQQAMHIRKIIAVIVILMVAPALYLAYAFIQKNNFNQRAEKFVREEFVAKGYSIIFKNFDYKSHPHRIELAFLLKQFDTAEVGRLNVSLASYHLDKTRLVIKQEKAPLTEEQWNSTLARIQDESRRVEAIEARLAGGAHSSQSPQILSEARALDRRVEKLAIGRMSTSKIFEDTLPAKAGEKDVLTVILHRTPESKPFSAREKQVLTEWIQSRLQDSATAVYFQP